MFVLPKIALQDETRTTYGIDIQVDVLAAQVSTCQEPLSSK